MTDGQIKTIPIKDYLKSRGIHPAKEYSGYGMYRSPFRDEDTPSLKVDYNRNLWFDFGSNEGGSIIDLVMKLEKCLFIEAIEHLKKFSLMPVKGEEHSFSFHRGPVADKEKTNGITLIEEKPLEHPKLLEYLQSRKISLDIAREHCREIHYKAGERNYFALGFGNDAGGFALRNPQFKGCLSPNHITTVERKTGTVLLFEGFIDYLSLITIQPEKANISAVVLNSVNNLEKALPFLSKHLSINVYLDNDDGGKRTLEKLKGLDYSVKNCSSFYAQSKDLNDHICRHSIPKKPIQKRKKGLGI